MPTYARHMITLKLVHAMGVVLITPTTKNCFLTHRASCVGTVSDLEVASSDEN